MPTSVYMKLLAVSMIFFFFFVVPTLTRVHCMYNIILQQLLYCFYAFVGMAFLMQELEGKSSKIPCMFEASLMASCDPPRMFKVERSSGMQLHINVYQSPSL